MTIPKTGPYPRTAAATRAVTGTATGPAPAPARFDRAVKPYPAPPASGVTDSERDETSP